MFIQKNNRVSMQPCIYSTPRTNIMLPSRSHLETLAVAAYLASNFVLNPVTIITMLYLLVFGGISRYIVLLYLLWIYIDRETAEKGGRGSRWFRSLAWWRYHRDYFPVRLHKTAPLPTDKNYFIGIFPHGVVCAGALSVFTTDLHDLDNVYPGIRFYLATISVNFLLPLFREIMHLFGVISVGRKSLDWVLSHKQGGRAVVVPIGGAAEAVYSGRGSWTLFLNNRKGFCKVAIKNGSYLVPAIVFGENDLFEVFRLDENSWICKMQLFIKETFGFLPIIFYGSRWYLLPDRVPLDVVVGKPIEVTKNSKPSDEEVEALHRRFIDEITQLFNEEKSKYMTNHDAKLVIV